MYTLSMRPHTQCPAINMAVNFEQERADWAPSTFSEAGDGVITNVGLTFYTPLPAVDITPKELAAMIAGLDTAYEALVDGLMSTAEQRLNKALYSSVQNFLDCLPQGLWRAGAQDWYDLMTPYDGKFIVLAHPSGKMATWDGFRWGLIDEDSINRQDFESAGECFGWQVLYNDSMDMDMVRDPKDLCTMIASLADALIEINTDARRYAACIFTVR